MTTHNGDEVTARYGPAEPARGIWSTAKQSWADLFRWRQRTAISNQQGEVAWEWHDPAPLTSPISLLLQLNFRNWIFYGVGLLAWIADAFDFHALGIQTVKLSKYYEVSKTSVTTAITLTLLLRSVGAALFGLAGDKFGRKWPMVVNMLILGLLQIGTIYSATFKEFLAVRALFGLFMGGVYGNATSMAMENCPRDTRGLLSGFLQQGYSIGYVLAACCNLGVGGGTDSWKSVFWVGACLSFLAGFLRALFPESKQFEETRKVGGLKSSLSAFWTDAGQILSRDWRIVVYCVLMMTWFNYYAHSSQDSYTTFLLTQKELNNSQASRASIIKETGAIVGGTIIGYLSQWIGRRRAIIFAAFLSGCLIPAWILPTTERSLSVGGFFFQFCVQGSWGVVPVHLNELAPPAFRAAFVGLTYQLGNMISAPSAQIVNAIAAKVTITSSKGDTVPAYGPTMGINAAIIAVGIMVTVAFGPERRGTNFEVVQAAGVDYDNGVNAERVSSKEKVGSRTTTVEQV